jgi:acyl-coenzyme A thioesterase PaaI-like protein
MTAIPGFAPTIGPVQDIAPGQVSLILAQQHLNYANRMHGAMMMLLLANAAHSQARHAMQQRPDAGQAIELVCADFGFVRSAHIGAQAVATAQIARATRTLMFLTAQVAADGEVLCTATLTYAIVPQAPVFNAAAYSTGGGEQYPSPGTHLRVPINLLGERIGAIHEQHINPQRLLAQFEVTPERCQPGLALLDDGMTLYVADSLGSRAAKHASGQSGVTVNLQLRRFGNAPLGAWVQIETEARQQLGDLVFIEGQFTVNGQALADFSGIWKNMAAPHKA